MNALENTTTMKSHQHHASSRSAKIKSLVWHLFQMIVAMEAGMLLYRLFLNQFAPESYRAATVAYPLLGYWMMMLAMTAPMIALMRYHKYSWRCCVEMTGAMLAPIVLLTLLNLFDVISFQVVHGVGGIAMDLAMVGYLAVTFNASSMQKERVHM